MNHSGDANKMVSDTPRTDAAKKIVLGGVGGDWEVVHIAFSRQLERELNAANERIKRLEEFARTIENDFDHDEDAHRYRTMCRVCDAAELLRETKAKEAKP